MLTKRDLLLRSAALAAITAATMKSAPVSAQTDVSPAEARAIAKEAYIYGFPIVDNYRIQHAYWVDRTNPEYKAPWNQICNMPRVFHAGGHGGPDAQLGHALLHDRRGPACRADRAHRAGDGEGALFQHPAHRLLHLQFRLHRHPHHRQRGWHLPARRAGLERRDAQGRRRRSFARRPNWRSPPIARSSSTRATSKT